MQDQEKPKSLKNAKKESVEDQDAVKIEATGRTHGFDEKDVLLRKRQPSDIHSSDEKASEDMEDSSQAEASNAEGELEPSKYEKFKQNVVDILESLDEDELHYIKIEHWFVQGETWYDIKTKEQQQQ